MSELPYICCECGMAGVKLWRQYQTFMSNQTLKCRVCSEIEQAPALMRLNSSAVNRVPEAGQIGWRVPAVPDDTGTFWGYTSAPQDRVDWWTALPDSQERNMDNDKPQRIDSSIEVSDENGVITTIDLPTLEPPVTLTIQACKEGGGKALDIEFSLEADDEGNPRFALLVNPIDKWVHVRTQDTKAVVDRDLKDLCCPDCDEAEDISFLKDGTAVCGSCPFQGELVKVEYDLDPLPVENLGISSDD